jgi:hypothetical protein
MEIYGNVYPSSSHISVMIYLFKTPTLLRYINSTVVCAVVFVLFPNDKSRFHNDLKNGLVTVIKMKKMLLLKEALGICTIFTSVEMQEC